MACRLCGNISRNRTYTARDLFDYLDETFNYEECAICGSLQLVTPILDAARYYPSQYYSFRHPEQVINAWGGLKAALRTRRSRAYFQTSSLVGSILAALRPHSVLSCVAKLRLDRNARILDVGCGSGSLLLDLNSVGYTAVYGLDPYLRRAIDYGNGVRVARANLCDLAGTAWDAIMFHHSLEHCPDPLVTLKSAANMLKPGGQILVRIPVLSWAWETYGTNWAQLDAPRHCVLHTERSLAAVAEKAGLTVSKVEYDSDAFQFWGSELACRGVPLSSVGAGNLKLYFESRALREFRRRAIILNQQRRGDQAAFYLEKAGGGQCGGVRRDH